MGRTDENLHFLAITQRLAETSVKISERLRLISGLQIGFNSINRVKAQITPELREIVQRLPSRTFLYVNGSSNPLFQIPTYSYKGKLKQILPPVPEQAETQIPRVCLGTFIKCIILRKKPTEKEVINQVTAKREETANGENNEENKKESTEESQFDGILGIDDKDALFPEEF